MIQLPIKDLGSNNRNLRLPGGRIDGRDIPVFSLRERNATHRLLLDSFALHCNGDAVLSCCRRARRAGRPRTSASSTRKVLFST